MMTETAIRRESTSAWRWAGLTVLLLLAAGGTFYKMEKDKETAEIIATLSVLENLDLLSRDDFDSVVKRKPLELDAEGGPVRTGSALDHKGH